MLATLVAAIVAASPSPSASPTAVPEIAHVVTSDRGRESAARTARTTYVVTAAQIARDGDRTVADALEDVPGVNVVRYGAFGAAATRRHSRQLVAANFGTRRRTADGGRPDRRRQPRAVSGQRHRSHRSRRRRRLDALRLGIDGWRDQHHHLVATATQHRDDLARDRLTNRTISFKRRMSRFNAPTPRTTTRSKTRRTGRTRKRDLTGVTARYSHPIGAVDLTLSGELTDALDGVPGELGLFSPTSEQGNVNRNLRMSARTYTERNPRRRSQLGDSSQDLSYTCNTPVDSNCPNSTFPRRRRRMTANPPYAQMLYDQHWMASLRNVVGDAARTARLWRRPDARRRAGRSRYGRRLAACRRQRADLRRVRADGGIRAVAVVRRERRTSSMPGLRGERDGGVGGAYSPSLGGILPLSHALQLKLNAATAFRAPTAEELYYPGFSNPNLAAGANARRRCDARRTGPLGRRFASAGLRRAGRT